jgi:hypothetical protein
MIFLFKMGCKFTFLISFEEILEIAISKIAQRLKERMRKKNACSSYGILHFNFIFFSFFIYPIIPYDVIFDVTTWI